MDPSFRMSELGATEHVEVEMIEAEPTDDDENDEYGQENEYTDLLSVSYNGGIL